MKKFFLQVFLQRFSLLVVLFLSGCSVADMLYVVSGRSGTYNMNDVDYTFTISDDGLTYTDKTCNYTLKYLSSSDYFVEYGGNVPELNYTYVTVALTDIGEFNGIFNEYHGTTQTKSSIAFHWHIYVD